MDEPRVRLPFEDEICPACESRLSTNGQSIQCDNGHDYPPESWSTQVRAFVIKTWIETTSPALPEKNSDEAEF